MNTNGNIYTVIYTTLVVVLVAAVLATVSQVLAPRQDANVKAETISQMLAAAKFYEKSELDAMGNDKVLEAYRSAVKEAFLIKADGTLDRNLDIESCEIVGTGALKAQNKFIKNGQTDKVSIPVVIFDKDGQKVIVAACYGAGLWGPIWGYIAVAEDGRTIDGAVFDHKSETPGLGAKIAEKPFYSQFKGKVFGRGERKFDVVKGGANGDESGVDAISGATITSQSLGRTINTWAKYYEPYLSTLAVVAEEAVAEEVATEETVEE